MIDGIIYLKCLVILISLECVFYFKAQSQITTSSSPTISSFSPISGPAGTLVTISGTNFSATQSKNIVYFGATKALVTSSTTTKLIVTVPLGTTYQPITVLSDGLIAYSSSPFVLTFSGVPGITTNSFASKVDFTTGTTPSFICNGDFDGDGKIDLLVTNSNSESNSVSIFHNTGNGVGITFANKIDFVTGTSPRSAAIGDLDGDGKHDFVVGNQTGGVISIFRNTSTGDGNISFASKVDLITASPASVAIDDLDRDGKSDIVVTNAAENLISVFHNTSSGIGSISFGTKTDLSSGIGPRIVSIGDFDGDGKHDIAVVNQTSNSISIFRNTNLTAGIISFTNKIDFVTGSSPMSVSLGDLDLDGKTDIITSNHSSSTISILRNISNGSNIIFANKFDISTETQPWYSTIGDLDGDTKPDIAVANWGSSNVSVFRNISNLETIIFAPKVDFTTGGLPYSVSIGDFDGDEKQDIAVANSASKSISTFRNTIAVSQIPTITSFNPNSGPIGTEITILGTNFSTTPTNNIVKINGTTATVSSCTITSITTKVPLNATTGLITVTVNGVTATSNVNFIVTPSIITGIENTEIIKALYPNPSVQFIKVELSIEKMTLLEKFYIYNYNGNKIDELDFSKDNQQLILNVSTLTSGPYLIELQFKDGSSVMRFVKE